MSRSSSLARISRAARVAEFFLEVAQLGADHVEQHVRVFQDADQARDGLEQLLVFVGELFLLQPGQAVQAHLEDLLRLDFRQLVAVVEQADARRQVFRTRGVGAGRGQQRAHQARLPAAREHALAGFVRVRRGLDQLDHLVDVGERDRQAFEDVARGRAPCAVRRWCGG